MHVHYKEFIIKLHRDTVDGTESTNGDGVGRSISKPEYQSR